MTDRDKAQEFVNRVEGVLEIGYNAAKYHLNQLREKIDEVAAERESTAAQTPVEKETDNWHPDVDTMLNDIADASEAMIRPKRGNDWVSGYRNLDRDRFDDPTLFKQLIAGWRTVPEQYKTKPNVSTQAGPVKDDILDVLKDIGKNFGI